jgi:hypothetical protein
MPLALHQSRLLRSIVGARIAAAQKWEFITPDFPREVL